jgi:hypothetical protein
VAREGLPRPGQGSASGQGSTPASQPTPEPVAAAEPVSQTPAPKSKPRLRLPEGRVARAAVIGGALVVLAAVVVLIARWLVSLGPVQDFLTTYPGESHLPDGAPVGIPTWLAWQHFFNAFFLVLIVRTGWQVRTQKRPPASWTPRWSPGGRKISLTLWLHQSSTCSG